MRNKEAKTAKKPLLINRSNKMKITLKYNRDDEGDTDWVYIHKDGKEADEEGRYYKTNDEWYSDDCGIEVAYTESDFIKKIEEYFSNK